MPTISKSWAGETTLFASSNIYSGADGDITDTETTTDDVDLETSGYEGAVVSLEYDSDGVADNIIIKFYGSTDGGTTYDDNPFYSQEVNATSGNDEQISFVIKDYPHFRIGLVVSGATDNIRARVIYDAWNWSSA